MERIAVITGANGSLGKALVRNFAENNWQVVATGRSDAQFDSENIEYHQFDAGDAGAAETFWRQLKERHPQTEICLVNNAGGYIGSSLLETTPQQYEDQMRSNYFTAVYVTRGLALNFDKARIINVISAGGLVARPKNSAYGAAKAAEMHFFQSLQKEFSPDQYRITNLYPKSIAFNGPDPTATDPEDLADFVRTEAENTKSYYLTDVTIYPRS